MTRPRTIDVHTHILTEETIAPPGQGGALEIAPKLTPIDDDYAVLEVAGTPYRPFPRGGWELERRFKDMDAAEVNVQVLSAAPQTYLYDQEPALTTATSALQNDQIAKLVKEHPDRFMGIATLPMQAPERAAAELGRAVRELGMHGAMIGSKRRQNLDDPSLAPLWATAEELGAFMLIHPVNVAGIERLRSYYFQNLIGNPLDTTIAAACLVFGGVMERHPKLNVLPSARRRLRAVSGRALGARLARAAGAENQCQDSRRSRGSTASTTTPFCTRSRSSNFWSAPSAPALVLLGSDYPYDMGTGECARQVKALSISGTPTRRRSSTAMW